MSLPKYPKWFTVDTYWDDSHAFVSKYGNKKDTRWRPFDRWNEIRQT